MVFQKSTVQSVDDSPSFDTHINVVIALFKCIFL